MRKLSCASETKHFPWTGKIQNSLSTPTSSQAPIFNCKIDKLTRQDVEFLWKVSKTFKLAASRSRFVFRTPKWNYWRKWVNQVQLGFARIILQKWLIYLTYTFLSRTDKNEESTSFFFVIILWKNFILNENFSWWADSCCSYVAAHIPQWCRL